MSRHTTKNRHTVLLSKYEQSLYVDKLFLYKITKLAGLGKIVTKFGKVLYGTKFKWNALTFLKSVTIIDSRFEFTFKYKALTK